MIVTSLPQLGEYNPSMRCPTHLLDVIGIKGTKYYKLLKKRGHDIPVLLHKHNQPLEDEENGMSPRPIPKRSPLQNSNQK
jgi:hypothetical protein